MGVQAEETTEAVVLFLQEYGVEARVEKETTPLCIGVYMVAHLGDIYVYEGLRITFRYSAYSDVDYNLHEPDSLDKLLDKIYYEKARLEYFRSCAQDE